MTGSDLYFRRNVTGEQLEWWFHGVGCREWLQAVRDTLSNEVRITVRADALGSSRRGEPDGAADGAGVGETSAARHV